MVEKNKIDKTAQKKFILIIFTLTLLIGLSLYLAPVVEQKILENSGLKVEGFISIGILSLLLGLIDGFNPCAMWVLIYLISLVSELKSKKKMWLIVGTFLFASGVIYFIILFLYMFGWSFIKYLGYSQFVIIGAGFFALICGIYFIYDYIKSKGNVECEVGDFKSKKKTMEKIKEIVHSPLTIPTFLAIILLAFSVNLLEFICSIGIPQAYTGILTEQNYPLELDFFFIMLYIITFLLDDLIIFYLALKAIDSPVFQKYANISKIGGGVLMVIIGLLLLAQIYLGSMDFTSIFLKILFFSLIIFLIKLIVDYYKK